jgi:eukaryotic-like serine/threonine-protein kinase
MVEPLSLGPFDLVEPLASGGMGTVWRGVHRRQGVPVAVKLIRPEKALSAKVIDRFRDEVRAIASMDHRGIVTVLDYGTVPTETADSSDGALTQGTPWLAMELCTAGTLKTHQLSNWTELAELLDDVLSALAFSHAKGILHRDLKPENILIAGPDDLRPGVKLADFGLAFIANESEEDGKTAAGTLRYMAPEQMRGAWRDFGPWTDLYAFGGLAWWLTCGQTPFQNASTVTELIRAHVYQPPPPLAPSFPVPAALDGWLRWLLKKKPRSRPLLAADALTELRRFRNDPRVQTQTFSQPASVAAEGDDQTIVLESAEIIVPTTFDQTLVTEAPALNNRPAPGEPKPRQLTPGELPHWTTDSLARPTTYSLVGAGLGLFGLRSVPLVGRVPQRDQLWECLLHTVRTGTPEVVLLRGGAGAGKSRLAQWLSERAHEVGVAQTLRATHSLVPGQDDGLPPMLAKALNCQGMSSKQRTKRLTAVLRERRIDDPDEVAAIDEFLGSHNVSEDLDAFSQTSMFLATTEARYGVLRRLLTRQSESRPVIVWLDDGQWGPEALELTLDILRRRDALNCRCLIVITVRDDLLTERPIEQALLQELDRHGATTCDVPPLDADERLELVQNLLGLEGDLAAQVEHRSDGNPLFAVQLVADWVQRGVLAVGTTGFRLADGARAIIPDSIHQLWAQKIDRFLSNENESARHWLELAATLGTKVGDSEWQSAGAFSELEPVDGLVGRLRREGLAHRSEPTQWSLCHGLLAESLQRQAEEANRLVSHHQSAAEMLATKRTARGTSARRAHHLIGAGRALDALDPLLLAARERKAEAGFNAALELLDQFDATADELSMDAAKPERGEATLLRVELFGGLDRLKEAAPLAQALINACDQHQWLTIAPSAKRVYGTLLIRLGQSEEGAEYLLQAIDAAERVSLGVEASRGRVALAFFRFHTGDVDGAESLLTRGLPVLRQKPTQEPFVHTALITLANVAKSRGDFDQARDWVNEAISEADRLNHPLLRADALQLLALVQRASGDLDGAATNLRNAIATKTSFGTPMAALGLNMTLGLVQLDRDDFDAAHTAFETGRDKFQEMGKSAMAGAAQACLLPCLAARKEWQKFGDTLAISEVRLREAAMFSQDIAGPVERAANLARDAQQTAAASAAYGLALRQWVGLHDDDGVRRVEHELSRLAP